MRLVFTIAILGLLDALAAPAAEFAIAPDRMAIVNGDRTFVIGLYENPADDAVLKRVAESGFNLLHASPDQKALDRLHAHQLWGWVNTGYAIDFSTDTEARQAQLNAMVESCAAHPALLVWEVPDEALWSCWYGPHFWRTVDEPKQLRELIKTLPDTARRELLTADLEKALSLRTDAQYAEAEALADGIWKQLGKDSPHPGYGLVNAAQTAETMCAGMVQGYAALRALDPAHPIWINHAPRNTISQLAAFNQAADIVGCDIYPITNSAFNDHSDIREQSAAAVGAYTVRMQQAAPGKPVWMVLQSFGWGDLKPHRPQAERDEQRRPVLDEFRFMAYDAIVRGARGVLFWGTSTVEKDSQMWEDLLTVISELNNIRNVLASEDATLPAAAEYHEGRSSMERNVHVLPKQVDGQTWLLVVNEERISLRYDISGLDALNGTTYVEHYSGKTAVVHDGRFTTSAAPQTPQVWEPKKRH